MHGVCLNALCGKPYGCQRKGCAVLRPDRSGAAIVTAGSPPDRQQHQPAAAVGREQGAEQQKPVRVDAAAGEGFPAATQYLRLGSVTRHGRNKTRERPNVLG